MFGIIIIVESKQTFSRREQTTHIPEEQRCSAGRYTESAGLAEIFLIGLIEMSGVVQSRIARQLSHVWLE